MPARPEIIPYIERAIMLVRGLTGWRSADLLGLFAHHSFRFVDDHRVTNTHGVYVSLYDTKAKKHKWSAPVFFPRLHDDYASLCLYRLFRDFHLFIDKLDIQTVEVFDHDGKRTKAKPLFICQDGGKKKFKAMSQGTARNYFGRAFLDNVTDRGGDVYAKHFAPHSARHAVASALADMGAISTSISKLTLNSPATLEGTYIMAVDRTWEIPRDCAAAQQLLPVRLLTPYVHWHSTKDGAKECACAKLLQQVPHPSAAPPKKRATRSASRKK